MPTRYKFLVEIKGETDLDLGTDNVHIGKLKALLRKKLESTLSNAHCWILKCEVEKGEKECLNEEKQKQSAELHMT